MKPTFHDHGKKLEWMNGHGQWVISPVVATFTHAGEEFVVVQTLITSIRDGFRVISMATGETHS